jgi:hypothetical protein
MTTKQKQKQAKRIRQLKKEKYAAEQLFQWIENAPLDLYIVDGTGLVTESYNGTVIVRVPEDMEPLKEEVCNVAVYLDGDEDHYPSYKYMTNYGASFAILKGDAESADHGPMDVTELQIYSPITEYKQIMIGVSYGKVDAKLSIAATVKEITPEIVKEMVQRVTASLPPDELYALGKMKKSKSKMPNVVVRQIEIGIP